MVAASSTASSSTRAHVARWRHRRTGRGVLEEGRDVIRHSTAHVMAQAVTRLWPGAHFAIGPVIENGFYYDFELPGGAHFTDQDLERIDERCARS